MEYCGPHGIPHSQFLKWHQDDQDKALAWIIDKSRRCQNCGTYPEDWVDEDNVPLEPPPMFARSRRCHGCATIAREEETIRKFAEQDLADTKGLVIVLDSEPPAEENFDDFEDDG